MKKRLIKLMRRINRRLAIRNLSKNEALWKEITAYMKKTGSTGVSWSDFNELYKAIRLYKPKNILECGPGASTVVMAYALMENEKEGYPGTITAMEELDNYLQMSIDLLPQNLRPYVSYHLSPRVDYSFEIFRGVRYENVPELDYDFIFVDGPEHHSPTDGHFCFDADFIFQLQRSKSKIAGMVDYRLSSSFVFQTLLGPDKVKFDLVKELAFIKPVGLSDLKRLTLENNTKGLLRHGRLLGSSHLKMYS